MACLEDSHCNDGKECTKDECCAGICEYSANYLCHPATNECVDCLSSEHCKDKVFCVGEEVYDLTDFIYQPGLAPYASLQVCDEEREKCLCITNADCTSPRGRRKAFL